MFSILIAATLLTGETSHPEDSFFAWKSEAKINLKASGFAPSEYTFALTPKGPQVCRTATFDYRVYPADSDGSGLLKPEECPFTVTHENGRTRYRYVFPWKFLNFAEPPKAGTTVRIAAFVNDQDKERGPLAITKLFDLRQSVPKNFGRIVLAE